MEQYQEDIYLLYKIKWPMFGLIQYAQLQNTWISKTYIWSKTLQAQQSSFLRVLADSTVLAISMEAVRPPKALIFGYHVCISILSCLRIAFPAFVWFHTFCIHECLWIEDPISFTFILQCSGRSACQKGHLTFFPLRRIFLYQQDINGEAPTTVTTLQRACCQTAIATQ